MTADWTRGQRPAGERATLQEPRGRLGERTESRRQGERVTADWTRGRKPEGDTARAERCVVENEKGK